MRLLDVDTLSIIDVFDDELPNYAILSHTWDKEEITFQDIAELKSINEANELSPTTNNVRLKKGFPKLEKSAALAKRDGYGYIWIDTCCIDKTSSAELSEAINSMYRWYHEASVCYAYLADVKPAFEEDLFGEGSSFRLSRWFSRGWTLQELIAPKDVEFFAADWSYLSSKQDSNQFRALLSNITGVNEGVLEGTLHPEDISVANRMKWASLRRTTRQEDIAYCLMGIFDVNMPLLYGEGIRAFTRLQEEILKATDDQSLFAWRTAVTPTYDADLVHGLLSTSPAAFKDGPDLEKLPSSAGGDVVPSSFTGLGIRVQLFLQPLGSMNPNSPGAEFQALLDCAAWRSDGSRCATIYLKRLWGDQFARIRTHSYFFKPVESLGDTTSGSYKLIFVNQKPSFILPDITVSRSNIAGNGQGDSEFYKLVDVFPRDRWDTEGLTFRTGGSYFDKPLGRFRLVNSRGFGDDIIVTVGMRLTSSRSCDPWFVVSTAIQDVDLSDQPPVNQQDESTQHSCQLTFATVRKHGKPFIELTVSIRPEIQSHLVLSTPRNWRGIPSHLTEELWEDVRGTFKPLIRYWRIRDNVKSIFRVRYDPWMQQTGFNGSWTELVRVNPQTWSGNPAQNIKSVREEWMAEEEMPKRLTIRHPNPETGTDPEVELLVACRDGDATTVESLLELHDSSLIETTTANYRGYWPLEWASRNGHLDVVRILLKNAPQKHISYALDMASIMGHSEVVQLLIQTAAKTFDCKRAYQVDEHIHLAAAYAPETDSIRLFKALQTDNFSSAATRNRLDETPLHRAAAMGNLVHLRTLLDMYIGDINSLNDRWGRSVLWHAACGGSPHAIEMLVQRGAAVNFGDEHGITPLHAACQVGDVIAVDKLLELGANPEIPTHEPCLKPIHYAALARNRDCLQRLILAEVNVNAPLVSAANFAPIHLAAANGWLEGFQLLWESWATPYSPATCYLLLKDEGSGFEFFHTSARDAIEIALDLGYKRIEIFMASMQKSPTLADPIPQNSQRKEKEGGLLRWLKKSNAKPETST